MARTLIRNLDDNSPTSIVSTERVTRPLIITSIIGALVLGSLTGFAISKLRTSTDLGLSQQSATGDKKIAGIVDKKTFKDNTEGILREGGIDGEGNFHLERPGGESQNVYLTSTTVDLSQFIGKKVKVWGETFSSEKAGWLMDVGSVEVK